MRWVRLGAGLMIRSVRRPTLALDLMRVSWRFRPRRWYRQFPFLPIPDRDYLKWRLHTAYGDEGAFPSAEEIERYARWSAKG